MSDARVSVIVSCRLLDEGVKKAGVGVCVFVDELQHLTVHFEPPLQRH